MTKRDQVDAVAQMAGITSKQARKALDTVAALIATGLLEEGRFAFNGLGTFAVQRRGPRTIRNPSTGMMMDLPASAVVSFKAAPELRDRIKERHA
jgi:DNA-binding protein HU-beta